MALFLDKIETDRVVEAIQKLISTLVDGNGLRVLTHVDPAAIAAMVVRMIGEEYGECPFVGGPFPNMASNRQYRWIHAHQPVVIDDPWVPHPDQPVTRIFDNDLYEVLRKNYEQVVVAREKSSESKGHSAPALEISPEDRPLTRKIIDE